MMTSHNWWLRIQPNAQKAFDELPSIDKKAVFHSLEQVLMSENPCYLSSADVVEVKSRPGTFRLKVRQQRIFYEFESKELYISGHYFKGTLTIIDIVFRNEQTYR